MLRARIRDLIFVGDEISDGEAYLIKPDEFTGWDDGVDMRRDELMRPAGHGAFDAPGYLGSRVTSIGGEFWAQTPVRFEFMRDKLVGLLVDGGMDRLTVDQDNGTRWADVRLAAKTTVIENPDMVSARYQIQFWGPNPRRFGETRVFGPDTIVDSFHHGNFPATQQIDVTGNMPSGYSIWCAGVQFAVTLPLLPGQTHRIDMATGRLYQGGTLQLGAVLAANRWVVPPGATVTIALSPVSGSGQIVVRLTDTFI